eukprot:TRINITY_DN11992_c0_g1_i1.p1 TRINITY_DN11992_c0_g1~~TRINITY_DN11992_c0_g1_i1.p1  ORF type:complete len:146 (+),score=19.33 TRINITY_DN11992_c0_g1_i1:304-741(+)
MNIVTAKLYIESNFWTKYNLGIGALSFVSYYLTILIFNTPMMSGWLQPEITGILLSIFGSFRAWIVLMFIPTVALAPDILWKLYQKTFKPTPADQVMRLQNEEKKRQRQGMRLNGQAAQEKRESVIFHVTFFCEVCVSYAQTELH